MTHPNPNNTSTENVSRIRSMLRDAVIEYINNREDGNVEAYMERRYPHLYGSAADEKFDDVTTAIDFARKTLSHLDDTASFVATRLDEDYNRAISEVAGDYAMNDTLTATNEGVGVSGFDAICLSNVGMLPIAEQFEGIRQLLTANPLWADKSWFWNRVAVTKPNFEAYLRKLNDKLTATNKDDTFSPWVTVPTRMTKKQVKKYVGKRCKTYERGCPCCEAWEMWDTTGTVHVLMEKKAFIKQLMKGRL